MKDRTKEQKPSAVPETAPQEGEIRARWAWVEPVVWTERMLATLETGIEGGKWFRLINEEELITGSPNLYFSAVDLFSLKQVYTCGLPIFSQVNHQLESRDAGELPVRFGGRGKTHVFPYPYVRPGLKPG